MEQFHRHRHRYDRGRADPHLLVVGDFASWLRVHFESAECPIVVVE